MALDVPVLFLANRVDRDSESPRFRPEPGNTGKLSAEALYVNDVCRMMKRRQRFPALADFAAFVPGDDHHGPARTGRAA